MEEEAQRKTLTTVAHAINVLALSRSWWYDMYVAMRAYERKKAAAEARAKKVASIIRQEKGSGPT